MSRSRNESGECPSASRSAASLLKDARAARKHAALQPALNACHLEYGATAWGEIPGEETETTCLFIRRRDGVDDATIRSRWVKARHLLRKCFAGAGKTVAVEQARIQQLFDNDRESTLRVDINHVMAAKRFRIHQHRQLARKRVELELAEDVRPQ